MSVTKEYAKELSLEVWEYLRDHPKIDDKTDLPDEIFKKVADMDCHCPLCKYFNNICKDCILESCHNGSDYNGWYSANDEKIRALYAAKIVEKIKLW
jgi:hypothetical protein